MHTMLSPHRHACLALLLICLLAAACGTSRPATPASEEFSAETNDRAVLQGNAEIQIPASASDLHGFVTGFRDVTTYVRFTVPRSDLPEFLRSTACPPTLESTDIRSEMHWGRFAWWQPDSATDYKWCSGIKEHLGQRVFLDLSDTNKVIVYVVASTR